MLTGYSAIMSISGMATHEVVYLCIINFGMEEGKDRLILFCRGCNNFASM